MAKKYLHVGLSILIPLFIAGFIMLIAFIIGGLTLCGNDCFEQYIPFFYEYYDKLTEGKSIFYSYAGSMGFDFYQVFSYYLASPLNFLMLLFDKEKIIYVANFLIILKIGLCGGTFSIFIKNRYKESGLAKTVAFSCAYALSGFVCGYAWNIMWMDGLVIFPLVMYGMDKLLSSKNNWYLYTAFLALMLITSYYMGIMACFFIALYFFTQKFENAGDLFRKMLRMLGASLLAVGMAAIILLPSFIGANSTHVSSEQMPGFELYGSFANTLKSLMIGVAPNGVCFEPEYANLFMTVFVLLLAMVYMCTGKIQLSDKIKKAILLAVLILSCNLKPLNFIWHGLHRQIGIPNRFSFVIIFVCITMAIEISMQKKSVIKKKNMLIGLCMTILIFAVLTAFDTSLWINAVISTVFAGFYTLIFIFVKKRKTKWVLIQILFYMECTSCFVLGLGNASGAVVGDYNKYSADFNVINEKKEHEFYREKLDSVFNYEDYCFKNMIGYTFDDISFQLLFSYVDRIKGIGHQEILNESTLYGINSMELFNSFSNFNQPKFYNKIGEKGSTNLTEYKGENPLMDMLLGVRYYYTRKNGAKSPAYEYMGKEGEVSIYKNKYNLSAGYVVPKALLFEDVLKDNCFDTMNEISKSICDERIVTVKGAKKLADTPSNIDIFTYKAEKDGEMLYKVNGYDIGIIRTFVNDKEIETVPDKSCVFDTGVLKKGDDLRIEVEYTNDVSDKKSDLLIAEFDGEVLEKCYDILSKRQLLITDFSETFVKGEISVTQESDLLVTIPYSDGFKVLLDGKIIKTETFGDLFYTIKIPMGKHTVEFKYETPFFRWGLIISAVSFTIFAVLILKDRIIKRKRIKDEERYNEMLRFVAQNESKQ